MRRNRPWGLLGAAAPTIAISLSCVAAAAQPPESPAGTPKAGAPAVSRTGLSRIIPVGGTSPSAPRVVAGKAIIAGLVDTTATPASVDFYSDGKLLGSTQKRPFRYDWDTTTVPDGEHTVKVVAVDAEGKELWSRETKVIVSNKDAAAAPKPKPPTGPAPAADRTVKGPAAPKPAVTGQPSKSPVSAKAELFKSQRHNFQVMYPAGWSVTDQTSKMKPLWPGGFWFVFSRGPAAKANIVINLRRRTEPGPTTAEAFARQPENAYVNLWQRTKVNGRDAFKTAGYQTETKSFVHRCIIVDGADIWMINCRDRGGTKAKQSEAYFNLVVDSLQPLGAKPLPSPPVAPPAGPKPVPREPERGYLPPERGPEPQPQPVPPPRPPQPPAEESDEGGGEDAP